MRDKFAEDGHFEARITSLEKRYDGKDVLKRFRDMYLDDSRTKVLDNGFRDLRFLDYNLLGVHTKFIHRVGKPPPYFQPRSLLYFSLVLSLFLCCPPPRTWLLVMSCVVWCGSTVCKSPRLAAPQQTYSGSRKQQQQTECHHT